LPCASMMTGVPPAAARMANAWTNCWGDTSRGQRSRYQTSGERFTPRLPSLLVAYRIQRAWRPSRACCSYDPISLSSSLRPQLLIRLRPEPMQSVHEPSGASREDPCGHPELGYGDRRGETFYSWCYLPSLSRCLTKRARPTKTSGGNGTTSQAGSTRSGYPLRKRSTESCVY
jgi:hypothetical protein